MRVVAISELAPPRRCREHESRSTCLVRTRAKERVFRTPVRAGSVPRRWSGSPLISCQSFWRDLRARPAPAMPRTRKSIYLSGSNQSKKSTPVFFAPEPIIEPFLLPFGGVLSPASVTAPRCFHSNLSGPSPGLTPFRRRRQRPRSPPRHLPPSPTTRPYPPPTPAAPPPPCGAKMA